MTADPGRVLILGAGPTGLGAAHRLQELGHTDYRVLEQAAAPGGLATSIVDDHGFTWDIGGHVQFSHYAYYDRVVDRALDGAWLTHERESWVWIRSRFVPYPFQNNLHRLDAADRARALEGLEAAAASRDRAGRARHFGDWIDRTFGEGIAEIFLRPYNLKVWGYPLDAIGTGWMGERVAVPDVARIRQNIADNRDDVSWGPNRTFRFPVHGGTGAIWRGVANRLPADRLQFNTRVTSIDLAGRRVSLENGRDMPYDTLISTLPLDRCCRMASSLPPVAATAVGRLRYSSVHVIGIGLFGARPETLGRKCWMYFPESHSPYYRITVFSNYSPNNVPAGDYWSLMAEVCESPAKPVDAATLVDDVVAAILRDGLILPETRIVSRWHHREEHGYPTPFVGRDDVLAAIRPALEAGRVFSRGRFGAWKYEVSNQDHSFMQGAELANRLVRGTAEVTLDDPGRANSGEFLTADAWL